MPDSAQLEHDAALANTEGHHASFAAHHCNVRGQVEEAHDRLTEAAGHYDTAARQFAEAAGEHLRGSQDLASEDGKRERERAEADYGRAAAEYWYAGRASADAHDFERAAEAMAAAAAICIAEAKLHEEDEQAEEAATLRVIAGFRYLDAQRYYVQAADLHRRFALDFAARGERRASDLDRRAQIAAGNAASEGPKYHADYQRGYQ